MDSVIKHDLARLDHFKRWNYHSLSFLFLIYFSSFTSQVSLLRWNQYSNSIQPLNMSENKDIFEGKYDLVNSENFDGFLGALGKTLFISCLYLF